MPLCLKLVVSSVSNCSVDLQAEDSPQAQVLRVRPGRPAALWRGQSRRAATHGHRGSEEAQQEQEAGQEARYRVGIMTHLICDYLKKDFF